MNPRIIGIIVNPDQSGTLTGFLHFRQRVVNTGARKHFRNALIPVSPQCGHVCIFMELGKLLAERPSHLTPVQVWSQIVGLMFECLFDFDSSRVRC